MSTLRKLHANTSKMAWVAKQASGKITQRAFQFNDDNLWFPCSWERGRQFDEYSGGKQFPTASMATDCKGGAPQSNLFEFSAAADLLNFGLLRRSSRGSE